MTKNTQERLRLVLETYGAKPKGIAWIMNAMKKGQLENILIYNEEARKRKAEAREVRRIQALS